MKKRFFKNLFGLLAVFAVTFVLFSCENETGGGGENEKNDNPDTLIYYSVSDVRSAAAGSNIVLAWTKPTENWNGVKISVSPTIPTWDSSTVYKTESTVTVPNAETGTEYTITFTTVKSDGSATDKSATIKITTPAAPVDTSESDTTAPGDVSNLSGEALDGAVLLTWTDATDDDIFGYEVTYAKTSSISPRTIAPITPGSIFVAQGVGSYLVSDLFYDVEYTFTVKTMDTSGNKSEGRTTTATPIYIEDLGEFTWEKVREITDYDTVTEIEIPKGYSSIGEGAFQNLTNLQNVIIPNTVKIIKNSAFRKSGLKSVNLGSSVKVIEESAFRDCTSLETIKIENAEIGKEGFRNCVSLKTIEIKGGTIGESAFRSNTSKDGEDDSKAYKNTVSLTLGNGVTSIGDQAFRGVPIGETLIIPDNIEIGEWTFDTRPITTGSTTYYYNIKEPKLKTLIIGKGVTIKQGAFRGNTALETIKIENAEILNDVFRDCDVLTDLEIKGGTIGDKVFRECPMIKNITIGKNVTAIGENVFEIKAFESITLENGNENFVYEGGVLYTKDRSIVVCGLKNGVAAFTFGSDYTYIPSQFFRNISNLESVTFAPDCKPTKIGSRAFNGTSIKTITIPSSVTEIGAYAFGYCSQLETINVESGNEYFTTEDGILYNKDKTEIVCYPSGKRGSSFTIPSTVQTIGYAAFAGNVYLETIEIGDNVTELGRCSMMDCESLKNVTIGSNVSTLRKAVFRNSPLESATFSDPTGWWYTVDENATIGDTMIDADYIDGTSAKTGSSASSLGNPTTAAAFLTAEFGNIERYWFKQN